MLLSKNWPSGHLKKARDLTPGKSFDEIVTLFQWWVTDLVDRIQDMFRIRCSRAPLTDFATFHDTFLRMMPLLLSFKVNLLVFINSYIL